MENVIKKKRIGVITFGITMILLGICIFLQTILKTDIFRYMLMLWPLVFIILGTEVLYYVYRKDVEIKYDILSIFLIFTILFFGWIFSMLNYGVNKVLYDSSVKESIIQSTYYRNSRYIASNEVKFENLSGKEVIYNVIESKNIDNTKVNIEPKLSKSANNNLINLVSVYNLEEYIEYNRKNGTFVILKLPEYIESLVVDVYTTDKSKIIY